MSCRLMSLLVSCILILPFSAHSQRSGFFWTTSYGIGTAWGDGSHVSYLYTNMDSPTGIAVDSTSSPPMIYYAERGADKIMRARYDGTDTVAIVTGISGIADLELDLAHRKIYWLKNTWADDRVQRADMDGLNSNVEDIYTSSWTGYDFHGIALDIPNERLYWTEAYNGGDDGMYRINWNKSGFTMILDTYSGVLGNPWDVDIVGDRLYWTDTGIGSNGIYSARKDGTDIDTVLLGLRAMYFVIDATTNTIYWTQNGSIGSAHLDGTDSTVFIGGLTSGLNSIAYCPGNIPVSVEEQPVLPVEFHLDQNWPNPFNPVTSISYTIARSKEFGVGGRETKLVVYDLLGREVAVLVNERKAPGSYSVEFDGTGLSSGVYFYRLSAGPNIQSRKMVLMK
jgi:hypothetical protein